MISGEQQAEWLKIALRFANLPANHSETDAARLFGGHDFDSTEMLTGELPSGPWDGPRDSYSLLRQWWVKQLASLVEILPSDPSESPRHRHQRLEAKLPRLRKNFEDRSVGSFLLEHWHHSPFAFDDKGRPQIGYLHAYRPEGILAVIGMELISPEAQFEVLICEAPLREKPHPLHGYFFSRSKIKGKGQPPIYCEKCRLPSNRTWIRNSKRKPKKKFK
jgi:hypothetical protein